MSYMATKSTKCFCFSFTILLLYVRLNETGLNGEVEVEGCSFCGVGKALARGQWACQVHMSMLVYHHTAAISSTKPLTS